MSKRKIIEIERNLCNGCGLCTTACAEGALELDAEGKAVLVQEIFCDCLGACLDVCPTGALKIVEKDSEGYVASAAYEHILKTRGKEAAEHIHRNHSEAPSVDIKDCCLSQHVLTGTAAREHHHLSGCPGSRPLEIIPEFESVSPKRTISGASELRQWPIQLHLVSPFAPYFLNSDLLIAADCTAFALGCFHQDLLKGKKLIIACPKLDETSNYADKLADLIKRNALKSLTVAIMTVPCCSGLRSIVEEAVERSGLLLEIKTVVAGIDGRLQS